MAAVGDIPSRATLEARLTPEGRIVVPAAIRRHLGVEAGDRLLFVTDDEGRVQLTTARALIHAVWANNHGGDGGNAGEYVREARDADPGADERPYLDEPASEEEVATDFARLHARLGLAE
jgi:AbrB family looped-hinge helix DNA binding protein